MKKIIIDLLIAASIAAAAFYAGGNYAVNNLYIEYLEPSEVPANRRDGSNFYYSVYSEFNSDPVIY